MWGRGCENSMCVEVELSLTSLQSRESLPMSSGRFWGIRWTHGEVWLTVLGTYSDNVLKTLYIYVGRVLDERTIVTHRLDKGEGRVEVLFFFEVRNFQKTNREKTKMYRTQFWNEPNRWIRHVNGTKFGHDRLSGSSRPPVHTGCPLQTRTGTWSESVTDIDDSSVLVVNS